MFSFSMPLRAGFSWRHLALGLFGGLLVAGTPSSVRAAGEDNPAGPAGLFSGQVHTAGSYNAYTGSSLRVVPDLAVPGAVGAYGLTFTRYATSRYVSVSTDPQVNSSFGSGGSWRHSFNWKLLSGGLDTQQRPIWQVNYPDGRSIIFKTRTLPSAPAGADPWLRAPVGLPDRLEPLANNQLSLHMKDGGQVIFARVTVNSANYRPTTILDPYNQPTVFTYDASGRLSRVTEPAGRFLQIFYKSVTYGTTTATVIDYVQASNGQRVTYNYTAFYQGTSPFVCLASVTYNAENIPGFGVPQASYTYVADNTAGGNRPLLLKCNDPHFPGPMTRLRYAYATGSGVTYGQVQAEIDDVTGTQVSAFNQTSRTDTRGDGPAESFAYGYANSYLLSGQTDFENGTAFFGYDSNSYLSAVVDRTGKQVNIGRDPYVGKQTAIYRFDDNNAYLTTTFNYGSDPFRPYYLSQVTDPRGYSVTYTRDPATHQVTRIDYPDTTFETFSYNALGQPLTHRVRAGAEVRYAYDEPNHGGSGYPGLLTSVSVPHGTDNNGVRDTATFYYGDGMDRATQTQDARGNSVFISFNGRHQPLTLSFQDNTSVSYAYDVYGNRTGSTDELGHTATILYDKFRRPTSIKVPLNGAAGIYRTTTFTYERGSASGDTHTARAVGTVTLPSGKKIQRTYRANGRLANVVRGANTADAVTASYTYDKDGRPLTVTDSLGTVQATLTYDHLNRWRTLTDALGHVTTWSYYAPGDSRAGLLASVTRPGNTPGGTLTSTYPAYDAMGRPTTVQDPLQQSVAYGYDPATGLLHTLSDARGTYTYGYDLLGRQTSLAYPDGSAEFSGFDPAGNAVLFQNRSGTQLTTVFDVRNRPTGTSWSDGVTPGAAFGYDAAGRLTSAANANATLAFSPDDLGETLGETQTLSGAAAQGFAYGLDADGAPVNTTYPGGSVARRTLDNAGHVTALDVDYTNVATYGYYNDWLTSRQLANGDFTGIHPQSNGRVDTVHQYRNQPYYFNISHRTYGYAPDGQMTWFNKTADPNWPATENNTGDAYTYAGDHSLIAVSHEAQGVYNGNPDAHGDSVAPGPVNPQRANTYSFDAAGNRLQANNSGVVTGYSPDAANRYAGLGYGDGRGNTTQFGGWSYGYNAADQLVSINGYGHSAAFAYDALGRCVSRTVDGVLRRLYYAEGRHLLEERDVNGALVYRYFYGAKGELVKRLDGATGASVCYHYDPRGYVTHLTDGTSGNLLESYLYDAYGQPFALDPAGNSLGNTGIYNNRCLFNGRVGYEYLPAFNLYLCGARFYSPELGRFLQPDPIRHAGGINLYAYCGNDPVNGADPSGLTVYQQNQLENGTILKPGDSILQVDPDRVARPANIGSVGVSTPNFFNSYGEGMGFEDIVEFDVPLEGFADDGMPVARATPVDTSQFITSNPALYILTDIAGVVGGVLANVEGLVQGIATLAEGILQVATGQVQNGLSNLQDGFYGVTDSLVPRYGNFGGPGYGEGRSPNLLGIFGDSPINALDALFQIHDLQYQNASTSTDRLNADKQLVNGLLHTPPQGVFGLIYQAAAIGLFEAKVTLSGG